MSAITGIFYRDGRSVKEEQIKKMNDRLSHRGPDGSAVWCEGPVALGHQMLHTTPESLHEKLPYEEDGLVITADARIDNRKELSEKLDIEDKEEISDSYFILKAYQKWGEKCPEELLGDFAFAIWDRDKEQLFCARDHMGVKPFYYYLSDDAFIFATEIKGIFSIQEVPYKLNKTKIAYYLIFVKFDKILTFYENIIRLPAAFSLVIDNENSSLQRYWKLDPELQIKMDSEEDYIKEFQDIFQEAVNCRLRSVFPIGYELSGGLDSSSIVCMAQKILNIGNSKEDELRTFAFDSREIPEVDEQFYVKSVTDKGGIKHQFVYADDLSPMYSENIYYYLEQPIVNPFITVKWRMYERIKGENVRILLSGAGGDSTISHGKYYLKDLAFALKFRKLMFEIKCLSKLYKKSYSHLILSQVLFPSVPSVVKKLWLFLFPKNRKGILNEKFRNIYLGKNFSKDQKSNQNYSKTARNYHYYELMDFDLQSDLEYVNRVSSAFKIELRYPFFDKRLVEFGYGIPDELKFRFGYGRYLQRIALKNILPDEIQWRHSKTNIFPIIERNLLLFEKNRLKNILYTNNELIEDYVDLDVVKDMYNNYISGNLCVSRDVVDLWFVMNLSYLLKHSCKKNSFVGIFFKKNF